MMKSVGSCNKTRNTYPKYDVAWRLPDGRTAMREEINASHVRLYLPDLTGRLRLILINDLLGNQRVMLTSDILRHGFGFCWKDIDPLDMKAYWTGFNMVDNLAPLCTWPRQLYPDGCPDESPHASVRQPDLPDLTELVAPTVADAWL